MINEPYFREVRQNWKRMAKRLGPAMWSWDLSLSQGFGSCSARGHYYVKVDGRTWSDPSYRMWTMCCFTFTPSNPVFSKPVVFYSYLHRKYDLTRVFIYSTITPSARKMHNPHPPFLTWALRSSQHCKPFSFSYSFSYLPSMTHLSPAPYATCPTPPICLCTCSSRPTSPFAGEVTQSSILSLYIFCAIYFLLINWTSVHR